MNKLPPIYKTFLIEKHQSTPRPLIESSIKKTKGISTLSLHSMEENGQSAWLAYLKHRLRTNDKKADPVRFLEIKLMKELYEGRKHS